MALQYFITIIGLVSLGIEFYEFRDITKFPNGLSRMSGASLAHLRGKRNVYDNNTLSLTTSSLTGSSMLTEPSMLTGLTPGTSGMTPGTSGMTADRQHHDPLVRNCIDHPGENIICNESTRQRTLTIFLLALLVGTLGVARCVAGFWCLGVVQCLTCGGCGIWWLLDWIFVLTLTWNVSNNGCCFVDNMSL